MSWLITAAFLVEVDYDGYDSSIIAVAATLDGAKQAAAEWMKQREVEAVLEWWQPSAGVWKASSPPIDNITIEQWQFYEDSLRRA